MFIYDAVNHIRIAILPTPLFLLIIYLLIYLYSKKFKKVAFFQKKTHTKITPTKIIYTSYDRETFTYNSRFKSISNGAIGRSQEYVQYFSLSNAFFYKQK